MPRVLRLWLGRESSASSMNIVGSTLLSIYCKAEVDIPVPWLERGDPLPKKGLKPHMSKFTQSFNASIKTWRKGRINTPGAAKQQCGNKLNYLMTHRNNYWTPDIWDSCLRDGAVKTVKEQTDKTYTQHMNIRAALRQTGEPQA